MEDTPVILDEKAREAVHAARDAAQAVEIARQTQLDTAAEGAAQKAAILASERIADKIVDERRMGQIFRAEMQDVLSMGSEKERAIVLARVPYICSEITNINERGDRIEGTLDDIKELLSTYPTVQKLVFGFAGAMLTGVVGLAGWAIVMVLQSK